jgi:hypothetical protein
LYAGNAEKCLSFARAIPLNETACYFDHRQRQITAASKPPFPLEVLHPLYAPKNTFWTSQMNSSVLNSELEQVTHCGYWVVKRLVGMAHQTNDPKTIGIAEMFNTELFRLDNTSLYRLLALSPKEDTL